MIEKIVEQVKSEEELAETNEIYNSLFENNHSVMLLIDNQTGQIVGGNSAACRFYGYSKEALLSKKISEINILTEEETFKEMNIAVQNKKNHFNFRHRLSNGQIRDVEVYSGPIKLKGKKLLYSIVNDITERKIMEQELKEREEFYSELFENNHAVMLLIEKESGQIYDANPAACRYYGYERKTFKTKSIFEINTLPKEQIWELITKSKLNTQKSFEFKHRLSDGTIRNVNSFTGLVKLAGKELIYSIVHDITKRHKAIELLKDSEEKFRMLFHQANDMIFVHEMDEGGLPGKFIEVNEKTCTSLGYTKQELSKMTPMDVIRKDSISDLKLKEIIVRLLREGHATFDGIFQSKTGKEIPVEISPHILKYKGKEVYMAICRDVTERKKNEEQIKYIAHHDSLTGLANRLHLGKYINQLTSKKKINFAVMFLDLDGFKEINDTLGHSNGDLLLKEVAQLLKNCVRRQDCTFRYGGDEFIIVLEDAGKEDASIVAQRIIQDFRRPFFLNGIKSFITTSIGISFYPKDGNNIDNLLKQADKAMYLAKKQGKNNFKFYSQYLLSS